MCFPSPIEVDKAKNAIFIKDVTAETCLKYLILEVVPFCYLLSSWKTCGTISRKMTMQ